MEPKFNAKSHQTTGRILVESIFAERYRPVILLIPPCHVWPADLCVLPPSKIKCRRLYLSRSHRVAGWLGLANDQADTSLIAPATTLFWVAYCMSMRRYSIMEG